jgi:hypothetical protein
VLHYTSAADNSNEAKKRTAASPQRSVRRAGLTLALTYLSVLQLLSTPAAAYLLDTGGFADGSDSSTILFDAVTSELTGPSLRVPTNATVTAASVYVSGSAGFLNTTTQETTSGDFVTNTASDNLLINSGTLQLATASDTRRLDSSNSFGNASLNRTLISGNTLVLNGATSGTFVSDNISVPAAGWGNLLASANLSAGGSINLSVLAPNGTALVASQAIGAIVDLDPIAYPTIRIRGTLAAPSAPSTPLLRWVTLGQATGDTMIGSGVTRTLTNVTGSDTSWIPRPSTISFTENATSPFITNTGGTYYSNRIENSNFIQVSGTWHMFAAVANASTLRIGHATSTDLSAWTWDAAPVILPGASGWDSSHVDHPWVMLNGTGPGYIMYYSGWKSGTQMQTGIATSGDLYNWTKYGSGPVLASSASGWDSWNTGNGVVAYESGTWKMWYAGSSVSTGGGNQLGYATSSDGFNWSKYASNPVLARGGAGAIDQDDLQLETVRSWGGVYHAYFACNRPTAYRVCYANSTDGTSWAKYANAVVGPSGSGWESGNAWPGDVVVNGGHFILFYSGCTSACGSSQTGRTEANFDPGQIRSTVDFGARAPFRLDSIDFQAVVPGGASAQVSIRSSSDGSTWSTYENLTGSTSISSTPARRFLDIVVYLNGSARSDPPLYASTVVSYTSFMAKGRYASSVFNFPDQISGVKVSLGLLNSSGAITIDVSNDNASAWTRVVDGNWTSLALAGQGLYYALNFEGTPSSSPIVDRVALTVEQRGFASNVTVRLATNGSRFVNASGPFNYGANLTLPVSEINQLVAAFKVANPNATSLDIPFIATSGHFGSVEIREPRMRLALKNPLTTVFAPSVGSARVSENASITFGVNASTYPAGIPINVTWLLDGAAQNGSANQASFSWTPDFFQAGNHTVRCFVENGDFFVNMTWAVFVDNVNRAPTFTLVSPTSPVVVSHTATTTFRADASDLDLETLSYAWRLDGSLIPGNASTINLSAVSLGGHFLNATVSDPYVSISVLWLVTSTNAAPVLVSVNPAGNFAISHASNLTVSVTASDADADPLVFTWRLDGTPSTANTSTFDLLSLPLGIHTLNVTVADPFVRVSFLWLITSTNAAPAIFSADPAGDFAMSHTAVQAVHVVVADQDGEPLAFEWALDGTPQAAIASMLSLGSPPVGVHSLTVTIRDAYTSVSFVWNVTSTNAAPWVQVVSAPPSGENRSHTSSAMFALQVGDADGDALSSAWFVNGGQVAFNQGNLTVDPVGLGALAVRFTVTDALATTEWSWQALGINAAPVVVALTPGARADVSVIDAVNFTVAASDTDGDRLTYTWFMDGTAAGSDSPSFSAPPFRVGAHTVRVTVSDGISDTLFVFSVIAADLPPAIISASPELNFTASHTARLAFSVDAVDYEAETLHYRWTVGSLQLLAIGNATAIGNLSVGDYRVAVEVSDGSSTVRREWQVSITDSPPTLEGVLPPPGTIRLSTFEDVDFTARAIDPDGDPVLLTWFDGNTPLNGTSSVRIRFETPGRRTVSLVAFSSGFRLNLSWTLEVTSLNTAPTIRDALPSQGDLVVIVAEGTPFALTVQDDGVLPLVIEWRVDGALVAHGTGFVYSPNASDVGAHTVTATASDGEFNVTRSWRVQVSATRAVAQTSGGLDLTVVLLLIVAIGAFTALLFTRRKARAPDAFAPVEEHGPEKRP